MPKKLSPAALASIQERSRENQNAMVRREEATERAAQKRAESARSKIRSVR